MEDWEAFCEFLSSRNPPRSLSESTVDDAVEYLLSLPSDRINKVVGSLRAATFGEHKENPFGSSMVRTLLKECVKEEKEPGEKKLPEGYESEIKGGQDDDWENLFEKCLTASNVNRLVIATSDAGKHSPFAAALGGTRRLLSFEDGNGKPWKIYCSDVAQKYYVFTKGWRSYVREKMLGTGDFVFFRKNRTDSSRLFIGYRRHNDNDAALGQRYYVNPDPTSPATSFVNGGAVPANWGYVLPNPTSSEMLRLPEHSNTGFDPILVIFCGENQDSEETYFISYIFNELCLRGFTPLRYDLTKRTVSGDPEMLYSSRVGIMIFSENYARSRECLDGFVAIMDHLKANKLELIPVFFRVSLSDVTNQSGSLGRAFLQLGKSVQASHIQKWWEAMIKLTSIKRYKYTKG